MKFRHERSGQTLELSRPWLWTLLFGPNYFAAKGVWHHVALGTLLALATFGWSWFVYPFFASAIMRAHLLRRGWQEAGEDGAAVPAEVDWAARITFDRPHETAHAPGPETVRNVSWPSSGRRAPRQAAAAPVFGRRTV